MSENKDYNWVLTQIDKLNTFLQQKGNTNVSDKEQIESLETAVQSLEKKLDAILKEMKTFNETNAH